MGMRYSLHITLRSKTGARALLITALAEAEAAEGDEYTDPDGVGPALKAWYSISMAVAVAVVEVALAAVVVINRLHLKLTLQLVFYVAAG